MVTPAEAQLITSKFYIGTPLQCAIQCGYAISEIPRFNEVNGFHTITDKCLWGAFGGLMVMTSIKTIVKRMLYVCCSMIIISIGVVYYKVGDTCRNLENIRLTPNLNSELRKELEVLLNSNDTFSRLNGQNRSIIEPLELIKLAVNLDVLNEIVSLNHTNFYLVRDSEGKLTHVGIGHARAYITYKLESVDLSIVRLTDESSVFCKAYDAG